MDNLKFKALVVREQDEGLYRRRVEDKTLADLPKGEVLVQVEYSSINYKDCLSAIGNKGVTRRYPHTPGIDAAGKVAESSDKRFQIGDSVVVSCYGLGMNTAGGFGQYIRIPAGWVMPRPKGLTTRQSMIYGTGGFTAAHSVWKLIKQGVRPEHGKILVTGATGGVGSFSVAILAKEGFQVTGVTGKESGRQFLMDLGATEVISRNQAIDSSDRMILKGRWAGVVDTVGGEMLATAIKSTRYGGVVTCCGNVTGPELNTTIFPFILRGVSLLGIDSAECPMALREQIWQQLATDWRLEDLDDICTEISLDGLDEAIDRILKGKIKGRILVNLQA